MHHSPAQAPFLAPNFFSCSGEVRQLSASSLPSNSTYRDTGASKVDEHTSKAENVGAEPSCADQSES